MDSNRGTPAIFSLASGESVNIERVILHRRACTTGYGTWTLTGGRG
jgi:hypothetical protein